MNKKRSKAFSAEFAKTVFEAMKCGATGVSVKFEFDQKVDESAKHVALPEAPKKEVVTPIEKKPTLVAPNNVVRVKRKYKRHTVVKPATAVPATTSPELMNSPAMKKFEEALAKTKKRSYGVGRRFSITELAPHLTRTPQRARDILRKLGVPATGRNMSRVESVLRLAAKRGEVIKLPGTGFFTKK